VRVSCPGIATANVLRLTAPSLASKKDVLLGGSPVGSAGKWAAGAGERLRAAGGELGVEVPAASAVLLHLLG
jgi:hypothetical protein